MIYKNQSSLRIKLTTDVAITGALVRQIKYIKPDGSSGNWAATSEDDLTGIIYYDLEAGDLDQSGTWYFWAYITFSDGRSAPGEAVKVKVYDEGE